MSYKPPRLRIPWPRWYGEDQDSNKEVENYKAIERWADQIVVPATSSSGGGPSDFARVKFLSSSITAPTWTEEFAYGITTTSSAGISLGGQGWWQIHFGIDMETEPGYAPISGAMTVTVDDDLYPPYSAAIGTRELNQDGYAYSGGTGSAITFAYSPFELEALAGDWLNVFPLDEAETITSVYFNAWMFAYYLGPTPA